MKSVFDTEQEALDYKAAHPHAMTKVIPLVGRNKWGLVYDIPCEVEVRDGGSDEHRHKPQNKNER